MRSLMAKPARIFRRLGFAVPSRDTGVGSKASTPVRIRPRKGVPRAHGMHIGKAGGTAIKTALTPLAESGTYSVEMHRHKFTLARLPEGDYYFFALRDPVQRFVSGFYSRQRKGRPRYFREWSEDERIHFERFASANDLAVALSSDSDEERLAAEHAMQTMVHLSSVWKWFGDEETFWAKEPYLLKVLFVDRLDEDFADLVERLGLGSFHPVLPHDPLRSHRAPSHPDPLTDEAVTNLRRWYKRDYEFLDLCRDLEARRAGEGP